MNLFDTLLQAIIQGLTEFLPVSSSGHLVVIQTLLGIDQPQLLMDIGLHVGTFLAVVIYFWKDLREMAVSVATRPFDLTRERTNEAWKVAAASVPTGIIGIVIDKKFGSVFESFWIVLGFLLVTAGLLFISDFLKPGRKKVKQLSWGGALLIGVFQGVAVLPGISRSGSTITGGVVAGLDRFSAGRFAFLIGIPALLGAVLLKAHEAVKAALPAGIWLHLAAGALLAFVIALFTIRLLFWVLKKARMRWFSIYLVIFVVLVAIARLTFARG